MRRIVITTMTLAVLALASCQQKTPSTEPVESKAPVEEAVNAYSILDYEQVGYVIGDTTPGVTTRIFDYTIKIWVVVPPGKDIDPPVVNPVSGHEIPVSVHVKDDSSFLDARIVGFNVLIPNDPLYLISDDRTPGNVVDRIHHERELDPNLEVVVTLDAAPGKSGKYKLKNATIKDIGCLTD